MSSLEGQLLGGRYRVVRRLGEGGMGAVYEAVQENLGRQVAIKVLAPELRDDAAFLERFRREAEAAGRLMHPHIVQVTDFVQMPGEPVFLVMELLKGRSLLEVLQRERLTVARACRIAVQLLSALQAAHAAGIVHRDLKPANVFLVPLAGGGELVKLLDFGIAKLMEGDGYRKLTQTGVMIGTPRYAAPEQIASRAVVDARTDLYAVGVLLYGMLAGRPPFLGKGAELLMEIQTREPPDLRVATPSVPPALAALVHRAMRKRPEERFASASAMAATLAPFTHDATAISGASVHGSEPTAAPTASAPRPAAPMAPLPPTAQPFAPPGASDAVPATATSFAVPRSPGAPPATTPHAGGVNPASPQSAPPMPGASPFAVPSTSPPHGMPQHGPMPPSPHFANPVTSPPHGMPHHGPMPSPHFANPITSPPHGAAPYGPPVAPTMPMPAGEPRVSRPSHEPRASHPAPQDGTASAVRWGIAIGLVLLLLLAAAAVGGALLFGALDDTRGTSPPPSPTAAAPEPAPAPPSDRPASFEASAAARALGPECEERERIACTCPHPHARGWCDEARRENAAAAAVPAADRTQDRRLCQESAELMRVSCVP